jgi:GTP cyclohydrolase I
VACKCPPELRRTTGAACCPESVLAGDVFRREAMVAVSQTGSVNLPKLVSIGREFLLAIGEDPDREGLKDTPMRWARMWREFIEYDPGTVDTAFEAVATDQLVVVRGMSVDSYCEHHIAPFSCTIAIGYLTHGKILGLSKFARIAHHRAHGLQVQERLVEEIARDVRGLVGPDVAVLIDGIHSCMSKRGIRTAGVMTTSSLNGCFKTDPELRAEFLRLAIR